MTGTQSKYFNNNKKSNVEEQLEFFFSQANSYFAEFFVEQCRRNSNKFIDRSEEEKYLIYNYSPTFSSREKVNYVLTEVYLFDKDGNSVQE